MLVRTRFSFMQSHLLLVALGASIALSMAATFAAASKFSPDGSEDRQFRPAESISFHLGSKRAMGTFSRENGTCQVTITIGDTAGRDTAQSKSAARLRLSLRPGQAAGFDSEDGDSIDMTCGEAAETLSVHRGTRIDRAVAQNSQATP